MNLLSGSGETMKVTSIASVLVMLPLALAHAAFGFQPKSSALLQAAASLADSGAPKNFSVGAVSMAKLRERIADFSLLLIQEQAAIAADKKAGRNPVIDELPLAKDMRISKQEEHVIRLVLIDLSPKIESLEQGYRANSHAQSKSERDDEYKAMRQSEDQLCDQAIAQLKAQLGESDFEKLNQYLAARDPEIPVTHPKRTRSSQTSALSERIGGQR